MLDLPDLLISAKFSQFLQVQKSIEHDYIMIIKVLDFQAMASSTVVRHERQEVSSTDYPRVGGSSPVRGNFFAVFFLLYYDSGLRDRMIYILK